MTLLLQRGGNATDDERDARRDVGVQHVERADAVDPHHRGRRIAHDAAGAARVRGRDDRGDVADVQLALEHGAGHRAADQRRGDVVEEARQHEHHDEQHETAAPVVGQVVGQPPRHVAFLEVPRQQREAHQQAEQVREHDPLVVQVAGQPAEARAVRKAGNEQLVERDRRQARERNLQRAVVQQRHAEQRQREQHELERDAERLPARAGADAPGHCRTATSTRSSSRRPSPPVRRRSTKSKRSTSVQ